MVNRIDAIPGAHFESLAKVLGECGKGSEISHVLRDRKLVDSSAESTTGGTSRRWPETAQRIGGKRMLRGMSN